MLTSPLVSNKVDGTIREKTAEPLGQGQNLKLKIESNISNNYYNKRNTNLIKSGHSPQKSQDMSASPTHG